MVLIRKYWGLLVVLLLSLFSMIPLFNSGFFPMHDDTQVARVYEMGKALKDGMFPVRWVADLGYGYGYPIFNFYSPLPYYIGGFFTLIGLDALTATKIMIGLGIGLSGIFMYFLTREFWGVWGGIVSALFYIYAPYHALDIYVRGAVGELYAYASLPLMTLGFYKVIKYSADNSKVTHSASSGQNLKLQNEARPWIIIGSIGFAGVILSHNLTAMMVSPLVIVGLLYCFVVNRKLYATLRPRSGRVRYLLYAIILGLLLSAFYWLPALMEMKYTNVLSQVGGGADFRDHFVCVEQLWNSQWGFGGSVSGCIDGMSFKLGKINIVTSLIALLLGFIFFRRKIIFFGFLGVIGSVFLTLEISKPIWEAIPVMAYFQYPWRFLLLSSFFFAILAGSLPWALKRFTKKSEHVIGLSIILIALLFYFNLKLFASQTILSKMSNDYTNEQALKWTASKISDEYMPRGFIKPKSVSEIVKEKVIFDDQSVKALSVLEKTQGLKAEIQVSKDSSVLIKTAPFPAWNVFIDGSNTVFKEENFGIEIPISAGNHVLELVFVQTTAEKIANILSLTGVLLLIIGIIYRRQNEKN